MKYIPMKIIVKQNVGYALTAYEFGMPMEDGCVQFVVPGRLANWLV